MSMGFFALSLRWLNPWQAMLCALLAFLHNLYIFPLYGRKKLEKEEEKKRGYTAIVSYPAVVLCLILISSFLSFGGLGLGAAAWAILAFGDSFGAIFGKMVGGPKLPWNKEKTLSGIISFFIFGFIAAYLFIFYIYKYDRLSDLWEQGRFMLILILAVFLAAVVESLEDQFDDNLGFPFVALSVLSLVVIPHKLILMPFIATALDANTILSFMVLMCINLALAIIAFIQKWVNMWGFIFGLLVGTSVIFSLGVKGFAILCLFYLFANFSTFYGRRIKEERGIAEGNKGTRGLGSVFSKGLAPALFCWFSFEAFVVALAFYAADTVATEFGKTSKRNAFLLSAYKVVPQGTVGAVSLKGTIAGVLSILIFIMVSLLDFRTLRFNNTTFYVLSICTLYFFVLESIINEENFKRQLTSKTVIHITMGFLAGAVAKGICVFLWMTK